MCQKIRTGKFKEGKRKMGGGLKNLEKFKWILMFKSCFMSLSTNLGIFA